MEFNYYNQTVDLFSKTHFPDGPPKRVVVKVSGGLDSASLIFLLANYFPKIEKHIFTGDDAHHPMDAARGKVVVEFIKNNIQHHNIKSHDVIPFNDRDPDIIEQVRILVENDPNYYSKYPYSKKHPPVPGTPAEISFLWKISKPLINGRNVRHLMDKYNCDIFLSGMTQNPPNKEMKKLGFYHLAETKRNEDRDDVKVYHSSGKAYHPYARVNKLFVKGVLENHGLMDVLYHITGSCTGGAYNTKYWMHPCEDCFWCHEKKWAFGQF